MSSKSSNMLPGKQYELALFIYTLINNRKKNFDIGKEIKFADKWDDLVVKVHENQCNQYTFLQIKLINDVDNVGNLIDSKVLLGQKKISLKETDFKLQKYFISYLRIKDQLNARNDKSKVQKLIIFTNAHLNEKEVGRNVGTIKLGTSNKKDIIPNTAKDLKYYEIPSIKSGNSAFLQEMKKNLKSDFSILAEALVE